MYRCVSECKCTHAMAQVWKSKDNSVGIKSLPPMVPKDKIQMVRVESKHLEKPAQLPG